MTIRDKMRQLLVDNGLFEQQADAVIDAYLKNEPELDKRLMSEDETTYPKTMITMIWMGLRAEAVNWIDANLPRHWTRPMFVDPTGQLNRTTPAGTEKPPRKTKSPPTGTSESL